MKRLLLAFVVAAGLAGASRAEAACTGPVVSVKDCGAVGDAKYINDAVTVNGSTHVTSATRNWQNSDVGHVIWCTWSAAPGQPSIARTTIASRVSANEVVTNATALWSASALECVDGTQSDTAAFVAAQAAVAAAPNNSPSQVSGPSGIVNIPCGGYIATGRILHNALTVPPPAYVGEGRTCATIFPSPDITIPGDGTGVLMEVVGFGARVQNLAVVGGFQSFPLTTGQAFIRFTGTSSYVIENVSIIDLGSTADSFALEIFGGTSGRITSVTVQDSSVSSRMYACGFRQMDGGLNQNLLCSNFYRNGKIDQCPGRNDFAGFQPLIFEGGGFDECDFGNTGVSCTEIVNGSEPSFVNTWFLGSQTTAIHVDATSKAWFFGGTAGRWSNYTGGRALDIDAGGVVYSSGMTWRATTGGNTSEIAVKNLGTMVDMLGNDYRLYSAGHIATVKSAAQLVSGHQPVRQ